MQRRVAKSSVAAASAVALALWSVGPAGAQNGYSFSDAGKSAIDYSNAQVAPAMACRDLTRMTAGELSILSAEIVPAADGAPEYCRVSAMIAPEVAFEVNLPARWNRRFYMIGNGGFAGEPFDSPPRAAARINAVKHGFVMAMTNTGHDASREPLATFAAGNQQKLIDYAFRAVHLSAATAKRIAARYYERFVTFAYWDGCSTGGRQGLMEAQRFPADFDGIVAGAPVSNFLDTMVQGLWDAKALDEAPLTLEKMQVVADAIRNKCVNGDNAFDGAIADPRRCDFDAARDLPKCAAGRDGADCVTDAQAAAVKKIFTGPVSGGKPYFHPMPVGSEQIGDDAFGRSPPASGWDVWVIGHPGHFFGSQPLQLAFAQSFMVNIGFGKANAAYDWKSFDFDKDPPRLNEARRIIDATNPDLSAFASRGGKLLMYHGWADPALTPYMSIEYHGKAVAKNGANTGDFYRLFMVPGMFHCRGGLATDHFDALTPLIDWVENGKAPANIAASRIEQGQVKRTRPLCPYPAVARYDGKGNADDASSYACVEPKT